MILTITVFLAPRMRTCTFNRPARAALSALGIVNGSISSIPTGTITLNVGSGPIIQGITSASSFTETGATFAPYDMISIFGAEFLQLRMAFWLRQRYDSGRWHLILLTLRYPEL